MIQIAFIDDDPHLRKRISLFFSTQNEFSCDIIAESIGHFFEQLNSNNEPDIILMDIELSTSGINSLDHLQKIKTFLPKTKVIIITGHNHPDYIHSALKNGADSYFLKGSGIDELLDVIKTTITGGTHIAPQAATHLLSTLRQPFRDNTELIHKELPPVLEQLTSREFEIARELANEASYKEIASKFYISINTVRHYVKSLYKKLEVSSKREFSRKVKPYI